LQARKRGSRWPPAGKVERTARVEGVVTEEKA